MGKRGPAPAPTPLKLIRGDRKSRVSTGEPVPSTGEIKPAPWLTDPALEIWNEFAPDLIAKGVLTSWDRETFGEFCDAVARRNEARAAIDNEGQMVDAPVFNRNGEQTGTRRVKNPWLVIMQQASETVRIYAGKFGLTAADRTQLKITPTDKPAGKSKERLLS